MHFCIVTLNEWDNLLCAKLYLDLSLYNFVAFYTALIILCIKIFQFQKKTQAKKAKFHSEIPGKSGFFCVLMNFLCVSKLHKISLTMIKYNVLFRLFPYKLYFCPQIQEYDLLLHTLWWLQATITQLPDTTENFLMIFLESTT